MGEGRLCTGAAATPIGTWAQCQQICQGLRETINPDVSVKCVNFQTLATYSKTL